MSMPRSDRGDASSFGADKPQNTSFRHSTSGNQAVTAATKEAELRFLLTSARTLVTAPVAQKLQSMVDGGMDWAYIRRTACSHGVLPLVYVALRDLEGADIPSDVLSDMRKEFHQWGILAHIRVAELHSLLETAAEDDISVIPFKGPVLGKCAYGDATLRKPGDLDLLVRRCDFSRMRELLIEAGYEPEVSPEEESAYLERRQGFPFYGSECSVDLHWTLEQPAFDNFPLSFRVAPEQIWSASTHTEFAGSSVCTLSNEHLLLYLCAHGAKHSWNRLYLICDVAELIRRQDICWEDVICLAHKLGMERVMFSGVLLAHELLDVVLPTGLETRLTENSAVKKLAALFSKLLFEETEQSKLDHTLMRFRLLDSLDDRLAYLWSRGLRTFFDSHR